MGGHRFPSLDEVYRGLEEFVAGHAAIARMECLGSSEEGRPVQAVHVTDPAAPAADKEAVLVVCGRHGRGTAISRFVASKKELANLPVIRSPRFRSGVDSTGRFS